jgi:hypothetical protein
MRFGPQGRENGWGATRIVFLGDEPAAPRQYDVGSDEAGELVEGGAVDPFVFEGQAAPLIIVELGAFAQLFFEYSNFLLQVFNDVLLVAVHPTGDREED